MNIYVLEHNEDGWDTAIGFVIIAKTVKRARELAFKSCSVYDKNSLVWLESTCKKVGVSHLKTEQVILESYRGC